MQIRFNWAELNLSLLRCAQVCNSVLYIRGGGGLGSTQLPVTTKTTSKDPTHRAENVHILTSGKCSNFGRYVFGEMSTRTHTTPAHWNCCCHAHGHVYAKCKPWGAKSYHKYDQVGNVLYIFGGTWASQSPCDHHYNFKKIFKAIITSSRIENAKFFCRILVICIIGSLIPQSPRNPQNSVIFGGGRGGITVSQILYKACSNRSPKHSISF